MGPDKNVNVGDVRVSGLAARYAWTGRQIKPVVKVFVGDKALTPNVDYALSYAANVKAGRGGVTVTGKGVFAAVEKTFTFVITPSRMVKPSASVSGNANGGVVKVSWKRASASQGISGYQLRYRKRGTSKWTTKSYAASKSQASLSIFKLGGSYQTQVRSFVNSSGARYYSAWSASYATLLVSGVRSSYRWTGKAVRPSVRVSRDGRSLAAGRDYKVSYRRNTGVGTAIMMIRGTGVSLSVPFRIVRR
jgi:hypothetical protein